MAPKILTGFGIKPKIYRDFGIGRHKFLLGCGIVLLFVTGSGWKPSYFIGMQCIIVKIMNDFMLNSIITIFIIIYEMMTQTVIKEFLHVDSSNGTCTYLYVTVTKFE